VRQEVIERISIFDLTKSTVNNTAIRLMESLEHVNILKSWTYYIIICYIIIFLININKGGFCECKHGC